MKIKDKLNEIEYNESGFEGTYKNYRILFHKPLFLDNVNLLENRSILSNQSIFPTIFLMLISSGNAGLAIITNDRIVKHKMVRKYMVRKKQGSSQLKRMATKGKTRGGGKLRLQRSREFFDEIAIKLKEWETLIQSADYIYYHCTPRLWGWLFKEDLPFKKSDTRLKKIPFTTYKSSLEELKRVIKLITKVKVELFLENNQDGDFEEFFEIDDL